MISNRDLYKEIENIEAISDKVKNEEVKAQLKIGTLQLKLLHNIRTNMVEVMKKLGVTLVPSKHEEKTETK